MLIILPDERFGLKNVIKKLDVKTIENIKDDENFNSVLIKKLNVNKGNAFSVKKNLFQVGEIESLSVHYERDSKESYAICRFVEAQIKLDAIKYATPFVYSSRVRIC